ncbi:MAG: DUF177 domain-containing protein [Cyanobacteriota bacterium]|nr:DUF177 domain-containing protein [Cyanobacteriota bacterium]
MTGAAASRSEPPLRPVPLPELRLLAGPRQWQVDQPIAGLASLTPVRGTLSARHHGDVLEVCASLSTILTLRCDRCLQEFNQALGAEVRELIGLREPQRSQAGVRGRAPRGPQAATSRHEPQPAAATASAAEMAAPDPFAEGLDPQGRFEPEAWIFEQLSLRLPLVNRCGSHCPGPATWSSEPPTADPRWAALQQLRSS